MNTALQFKTQSTKGKAGRNFLAIIIVIQTSQLAQYKYDTVYLVYSELVNTISGYIQVLELSGDV